jgi:hypothetical protein
VAPTLSTAAGIRPPAGLDGNPLPFVFSEGVHIPPATQKSE